MQEQTDRPGHAYSFLTPPEVQFLDAAVSRLIPADELGPGAKEADVTYFIDGQLVSSWGTHGRNYRSGPWREGTPQQGFQSPLTPQGIYRHGIREINAYCVRELGKRFDLLASDQQVEVLKDLEAGKIDLESLSSALFFSLLLKNTKEGFLTDPMYGGNRDKIGWKLVGFPGVAASNYTELMQKHNVPYDVEPVSILDVAEGRVPLDGQGFPKHIPLKVKR